jgi:serine/threonine protein kinase
MDGHAVSTIGGVSTHVGTSLGGRYRLDAQIGHGGMSTVYRAFDTVLERQVAVKLMHRDIAHNPDQLERFRREARAVAQLNHPHIVQVIDAGEDDAMPFIVFEYVEGETLKERIRRFGSCRSPRRWPTRSRSRGRSAPRTTAASCTATSSRRTSSSTRRARGRSPTSASRARSSRTA